MYTQTLFVLLLLFSILITVMYKKKVFDLQFEIWNCSDLSVYVVKITYLSDLIVTFKDKLTLIFVRTDNHAAYEF